MSLKSWYPGLHVLVTGAAGSIGRQLCRQLLGAGIARLDAWDQDEPGLQSLSSELAGRARAGQIEVCPELRSLFAPGLRQRLSACRPHWVLHAAAYKHVPFLESQASAAVLNNVAATRRLLRAAATAGVECFVLISSDKAAGPASVLGASKRMAELDVRALAEARAWRAGSVRLVNVLHSRGSVSRIFARQIAAGSPLTITHPDMERYFMTANQAARAVLAAARALGPGDLLMPPVAPARRILDLARAMAGHCGPSSMDLNMRLIGTRPGDRLREPLLGPGERFHSLPGCRLRKILGPSPEPFLPWVDQAIAAAESGEEPTTRRILQEFMLAIQQPPGCKSATDSAACMNKVG